MSILLAFVGAALVVPTVVSRLSFLAPYKAGALFFYANVLDEFLVRRKGLKRRRAEHVMALLGVVLSAAAGAPCLAAGLVAVVGGLELRLRYRERQMLDAVWAQPDPRTATAAIDQGSPSHRGALPGPSVHPELVINFIGPFVARLPTYDLGDLALGRTVVLRMTVGNHSIMPAQVPIQVRVTAPSGLRCSQPPLDAIAPLKSGAVASLSLTLTAERVSGPSLVCVEVEHGPQRHKVMISIRSVFDQATVAVASAVIERWPGATRTGFAWRGDMDLYDTVSFQSIEGLEHTFGLAARYRFPQTMYLSARLSVDQGQARALQEHHGVARGWEEIPAFIEWMNERVELSHVIRYPFESDKPYAIELGNHMWLHYGTDAAMAPENGWRRWARMGAGRYPWQGDELDSFSEQRDNAARCNEAFAEAFGFTPKSWAMPDSTNDSHTPGAVAAAGCEVTSDADASPWSNVVDQPPPHHPPGTNAIELTKRWPGDPLSVEHVDMNVYWMHRGWRLGIPVLFMCHQHLRMYEGHSCTRFTEYLLRYALTAFNGDLHVNTVFGLGAWWDSVLCPEHRTLSVDVEDGVVVVDNRGPEDLEDVPVDLDLGGGRTATLLVDAPAGSTRRWDLTGAPATSEAGAPSGASA